MATNSTMSKILNGAENFLSSNANAARDIIVNPVVDLGSYAAKGYARGVAGLLGKDPDKAAAAVDKVADVLKTGGGYNPKQEVDPTSIAGAVGDGLIRGVDQALGLLTLTDLARQLPKVAQKGWKTILNKVNKAKTPEQQKAVAKEARDYVTKHIEINDDLSKRMYNQSAEVPAYQQRAYAAENPGMSKYKTEAASTKFAVTKDGDTTIGWPMTYYENSLKQKLTPDMASQLGIPYGGKNMKNIRNVQKEVQNLAKMSDKDFRELMQSKSRASWAGYDDWRYNLGDDWINNWNNPKEYQRMKEQIVDNILNDAGLNYGVAESYGDAIKSSAAKSSKRYRNWLKKDMKDTYDIKTKGRTRQEARDISEYRSKGSQGYTPAELRAMEREMLNDADAEAASIAAGERAYKHEGSDPTVWF